jgi:hypothetical protein
MSRRLGLARVVPATKRLATSRVLPCVAALLAAATSGCSAIEKYSVRAAENSCGAVSVCTVYGQSGEYLSPCVSAGRQTVYPGDPRWPYTTPGVCDVVRDGRVVSSRDGDK